MTHSLLVQDDSRRRATNKTLVHHMAFYSLYQRVDNHWRRVSQNCYSEKLAYRVFMTQILSNPLNYRIRKVNIELDSAQSRLSRFRTARPISPNGRVA